MAGAGGRVDNVTDGCKVKGWEVEHGWLEETLRGKLLAAFP